MDTFIARVDVGRLCPVYLKTPRLDNGMPRIFNLLLKFPPDLESSFPQTTATCPLARDSQVRGSLAPTGKDRASNCRAGDIVEAEILCHGCDLNPRRTVMYASVPVTTRT